MQRREGAATRIVGALMLASTVYAITQTLLIPALPEIQREVDTTAVGATSLISVFFISGAVTAGTIGRLGDMFGRRRLLLTELWLFAAGACLCAVAHSLALLLVGRIIMGTALAIFPLAFSIIRDTLSPDRIPGAIILIAATNGTGAALGQATGGFVTDHLGYHWVFWIGCGGALAALVGVAVLVPSTSPGRPGRVDVLGALLMGCGVGIPLYAISQTPVHGWTSVRTIALAGTGLLFFRLFLAQERRAVDPLLNLRTLAQRAVAIPNVVAFLTGFAIFGAAAIFTQFFQEPTASGFGFGASATEAGLYLVPGYLMIMLAAPIAERLSTRAGPRATLILGCGLAAVALALMGAFHADPWQMCAWTTILYAGAGFALGALPTLILQAVSASESGQSTAVNLISRYVGTAVGTQAAAALVAASVATNGLPSEAGYTRAVVLQALAAGAACLVALTIPRRPTNAVSLEKSLEEGLPA
jgi:predicted MFS family arabinose efflux permease